MRRIYIRKKDIKSERETSWGNGEIEDSWVSRFFFLCGWKWTERLIVIVNIEW